MTVRATRAEVDAGAIAHNVSALARLVAPAELCVVVKADGYGHGAVGAARAALAAGATRLAVALTEEGAALRAAAIDAPVLLLSEPPPADAPAVIRGPARTRGLHRGRASPRWPRPPRPTTRCRST